MQKPIIALKLKHKCGNFDAYSNGTINELSHKAIFLIIIQEYDKNA